jgi:hypothetical protein
VALLGKVVVGLLVPNFANMRYFRKAHLRDCLVVGFSMAAEGEFAFVIAVFSVVHNLITEQLYASVVLAVLISTIVAPLCLRVTIGYFNKQIESVLYGETGGDEENKKELLSKSIREQTAVFYCIQTKSAPSWGLQTNIIHALDDLHLEVIDHRAWHPRVERELVLNEVYVKDAQELSPQFSEMERERHVLSRIAEIETELASVIGQKNARIRVQRWIPELVVTYDSNTEGSSSEDGSIAEQIVKATSAAFEKSQKRPSIAPITVPDSAYVAMEEELMETEESGESQSPRGLNRQISHLDMRSNGRLEGLFRRDKKKRSQRPVRALTTADSIELLDSHGIGTGYKEVEEEYDVHGASIA